MPLVEIDAVDDALHGLVQRRILKNDVGSLAAELQGHFLVGASDRALDDLADVGGAGKGDFVNVGMVHQLGAGRAEAGDDVDDAGRQVGLLDQFGQFQCGERGRLGRLEHHAIPCRQCRREFPSGHEQREIPRNDLTSHAERLRAAVGECILQLVGPTCIIEEVVGGQWHVHITRLADRLAAVHGLDHRKLAGLLLQHPRDAEDVFATVFRRHVFPILVVGVAGGAHGLVHVGLARLGDAGDLFLGGGIDRVEVFARLGLDPLSADEELILLLELDVVAALGAGAYCQSVSNCKPIAAGFLSLAMFLVDGEVIM